MKQEIVMSRPSTKKLDYIQHGSVPTKEQEIEHDYELAEVQDEILNPETIKINVDGKEYHLPLELSILDIRNKVENSIIYFQKLLASELNQIRPNIEWADPIVTGVVFKASMQNAMEELLSIITKKPVSAFAGKLDETAVINTFTWVLQILNKKVKEAQGASEAPKT